MGLSDLALREAQARAPAARLRAWPGGARAGTRLRDRGNLAAPPHPLPDASGDRRRAHGTGRSRAAHRPRGPDRLPAGDPPARPSARPLRSHRRLGNRLLPRRTGPSRPRRRSGAGAGAGRAHRRAPPRRAFRRRGSDPGARAFASVPGSGSILHRHAARAAWALRDRVLETTALLGAPGNCKGTEREPTDALFARAH